MRLGMAVGSIDVVQLRFDFLTSAVLEGGDRFGAQHQESFLNTLGGIEFSRGISTPPPPLLAP
jgi:hypothetical protein